MEIQKSGIPPISQTQGLLTLVCVPEKSVEIQKTGIPPISQIQCLFTFWFPEKLVEIQIAGFPPIFQTVHQFPRIPEKLVEIQIVGIPPIFPICQLRTTSQCTVGPNSFFALLQPLKIRVTSNDIPKCAL